ncbi:MAG: preprotein translocase subunit SecE [Candidatus Kerfeldbacteria bacterium]|nr:preprotein translocase subunit SecE [Candidatus Kerfeldbacteria bacterium]
MNVANRIVSYFREARDELRKVVWPARQKTLNDTLLVIVISLAVAAFLGAIDFILNIGLRALIER